MADPLRKFKGRKCSEDEYSRVVALAQVRTLRGLIRDISDCRIPIGEIGKVILTLREWEERLDR